MNKYITKSLILLVLPAVSIWYHPEVNANVTKAGKVLEKLSKLEAKKTKAMEMAAKAQYIASKTGSKMATASIKNKLKQGATQVEQRTAVNNVLSKVKPDGDLKIMGLQKGLSKTEGVSRIKTMHQLEVANDIKKYTHSSGRTKLADTPSKLKNARSNIKGQLGELLTYRAALGAGYKVIPQVKINRASMDFLAKHPITGKWGFLEAKAGTSNMSKSQKSIAESFSKKGGTVTIGKESVQKVNLPPTQTTTVKINNPKIGKVPPKVTTPPAPKVSPPPPAPKVSLPPPAPKVSLPPPAPKVSLPPPAPKVSSPPPAPKVSALPTVSSAPKMGGSSIK